MVRLFFCASALRLDRGVPPVEAHDPSDCIRPAADARYELVDKVLAVTKRASITKMGFVGNEAYADDF